MKHYIAFKEYTIVIFYATTVHRIYCFYSLIDHITIDKNKLNYKIIQKDLLEIMIISA
jgi:hypothetical protein